ncbi:MULTISPECIES: MarR family winged helix-turn-helix transcriptional regulator [Chryseobacterium]|uniref:DNA-binding MarR family transcriptional regulator n=1 Tax=Chryseobacterium camelliae TaxID=1265445 RepID=A0ABU0TK28_9FLAO|nr:MULTISPECIES: MarR family transcriptional regulator [Chryseobacterium]MDT3409485.1 DNA-binding MarR family transcriptional regulator [Pseudacidovorax intermedius]MDQ1096650.1 DNA-binding MarR family transcriptional regulator [Chryseobacterium camelliae]MDQ1100592.1 DNA-binding MarR family transcriptional regulator [Chryseobacterium sp. SORGH_AS_1048]MDR6087932.1 DNA-binding MarR family transcriptional regulator [Chryseobacterium sp. SORGH_AS_0909]MDR6132306.1 DNA-binding MarR family transcr
MKSSQQEHLSKISRLIETMRDIRKVVRTQFMKKMKDHDLDLTIEMLEVLHILWNKDNVNQQEIVDKTNRNKASITSLIDNMAARGLVQRNTNPLDRRNKLISLTTEGERYQQKLIPLLEEVYAPLLSEDMIHEIENATSKLQHILQTMSK